MTTECPGHIALRAVDDVLVQRPRKNDLRLSTATECLCVFRDRVIGALRADGGTPQKRDQLARLNSVLSVVLGCHFPIDKIPWDELDKARDWLADLVSEIEPGTITHNS